MSVLVLSLFSDYLVILLTFFPSFLGITFEMLLILLLCLWEAYLSYINIVHSVRITFVVARILPSLVVYSKYTSNFWNVLELFLRNYSLRINVYPQIVFAVFLCCARCCLSLTRLQIKVFTYFLLIVGGFKPSFFNISALLSCSLYETFPWQPARHCGWSAWCRPILQCRSHGPRAGTSCRTDQTTR